MPQTLPNLLNSAAHALGADLLLVSSGPAGPTGHEPAIIAASDGARSDAATYTPGDSDIEVPVVYAEHELARLVARYPAGAVDRRLLEGFAIAAGFVLGRVQELLEAGYALQESHLFHELGEYLSGATQLDDSLRAMLRSLRSLLHADYAGIALVEADGSTRWQTMDGSRTEKYKEVVYPPGHGTAGLTIAAGKPIVQEGIGSSPDLPSEEYPIHTAEGGVSVMSAPLMRAGRAMGALIVGSRTPRHWKEQEITLTSAMANTLALAIEQARASASEGAQHAFLSKVVENFPGALIVMEPPDWRVLLINANFTALLPEPYRSGAPVIGRTAREITQEWTERSEAIITLMQQVADTGETFSFEQYASETPERGLTYWNWSVVPVEGAGTGGRRVVMLLAQEVTEMVQAREKVQRSAAHARARAEELEAIINQMADGVSIFDASGKVVRINPAGQRLLGRGVEHDIDSTQYSQVYGLYTLDGEPLPREEATYWRALQGETVTGQQVLTRRPGGEETILSVSGSPLTDGEGNISGAVLVFHDITQEKLNERLKDEFLSVVSHELRTPLSAIMGYSDLMLRGLHGGMNERQTRALNAVRANADRLLRLINDLLDVSKLESGVQQLEPEPVNLADVVSRTVAQTRVLAVTAGVDIHNRLPRDDMPKVLADEAKLQQILENLLSNAIKFTPQGGAVSFTAAISDLPANEPALPQLEPEELVAAGNAQSVVVTVSDTGTGLEEEQLSRIWDRFYQVDSSAKRRSGGTGLGLAIVRSLVELHGGQAWARSKGAGHGSSFSFSLPVAPGSAVQDRFIEPRISGWRRSDRRRHRAYRGG